MKNQYEIDYQQGYDNANEKWLERMDKIRAEIETKYGQCSICEYDSDYGGKWYEVGDIADILQIIDECKDESEE